MKQCSIRAARLGKARSLSRNTLLSCQPPAGDIHEVISNTESLEHVVIQQGALVDFLPLQTICSFLPFLYRRPKPPGPEKHIKQILFRGFAVKKSCFVPLTAIVTLKQDFLSLKTIGLRSFCSFNALRSTIYLLKV